MREGAAVTAGRADWRLPLVLAEAFFALVLAAILGRCRRAS